ncbi:MAG: hypothetical protein JW776_09145 [Candidatus Lokiarchaeota archaeon]|nr:hypothetical protein [Candidatus Lokiarchaeota archaeon]
MLNGSSQETYQLHSTISKIRWQCSPVEWFPDENGEFGNHTLISFEIEAKIKNNGESDIITEFGIYYQFEGEDFPLHTNTTFVSGLGYNELFSPGVNLREFRVNILYYNTIIDDPLPGTYTFWVTDYNYTTITYNPRNLVIYNSQVVNFLVYDYVYIIIGIVSIGAISILSWMVVKKVHQKRLPMILSKRLVYVKSLEDNVKFNEAKEELEDVVAEINQLDDKHLNNKWKSLNKRCTINLNVKDRLTEILNANKHGEAQINDTNEKLLELLKEVHKYSEIDPLIESDIVDAIKSISD